MSHPPPHGPSLPLFPFVPPCLCAFPFNSLRRREGRDELG
jgi:hypothetical protein